MAFTTGYAKTHPFGTKILYTTGTVTSPTSYAVLGDVKSINIGGVEFGESNITHLLSANAFQESMAGWGKAKPVSFDVYYHETNLLEMLETIPPGAFGRATNSFLVQFNAPTSVTTPSGDAYYYVTAWVKDINFNDISADSDDAIIYKVELQPTGRPDFSTS